MKVHLSKFTGITHLKCKQTKRIKLFTTELNLSNCVGEAEQGKTKAAKPQLCNCLVLGV